jgi:hypothetical protein
MSLPFMLQPYSKNSNIIKIELVFNSPAPQAISQNKMASNIPLSIPHKLPSIPLSLLTELVQQQQHLFFFFDISLSPFYLVYYKI